MKLPLRIAAIVPLACLVCPLVELFDRWDKTPQTGNDTEFVFMIVALCFGAAYLLTHLMAAGWFACQTEDLPGRCKPSNPSSVARPFADRSARRPLIPISPPPAALRI